MDLLIHTSHTVDDVTRSLNARNILPRPSGTRVRVVNLNEHDSSDSVLALLENSSDKSISVLLVADAAVSTNS